MQPITEIASNITSSCATSKKSVKNYVCSSVDNLLKVPFLDKYGRPLINNSKFHK